MTLMPVSNICLRGSSSSNGGASRWMSQCSIPSNLEESASRASPHTLKMWPSTSSPTGICSPWPVLRTGAPRVRPSVGRMQMARTRLPPICWATSASTLMVSPSASTDISMAWFSSGMASWWNSMGLEDLERMVVGLWLLAGGQRFGATDDLHDLGGDGVLASPVHHPRVALDELLGVVGGGLHGPLAGGLLGGGGVEEGGVDAGLDVAGQQRLEDLARRRLELVVG